MYCRLKAAVSGAFKIKKRCREMVGNDQDFVRNERPRKINVKVYDPDGKRLGIYPVHSQEGEYLLTWKGQTVPVRRGENGPQTGKYFLVDATDAAKLARSES